MMRTGLITLLICTFSSVILLSCGDDSVSNCPEFGTLSGRVVPADPGEVILSGTSEYRFSLGTDGRIFNDRIAPGLYDVTIQPANYSKREFRDCAIVAGSAYNLGEFELTTLPWPIAEIEPSDGATDVEFATTLTFVSYERFDLEDLTAHTSTEPQIEGSWQEVDQDSLFTYYYGLPYGTGSQLRARLLPSTTYTFTIDGELLATVGGDADTDLEVTFSTSPLAVSFVTRPTPGAPVPLQDFHFDLIFNTCVSEQAVKDAVTFDPPIDGFWLGDVACQDNPFNIADGFTEFRYFPLVNTLPEATEYTVTVRGDVNFVDNISLGNDTTFTFVTESPRINFFSPANGTAMDFLSYIKVGFSLPMDHASVEEAFSVRELHGDLLDGSFYWYGDTRLEFGPIIPHNGGDVLLCQITTAARSTEGVHLQSGLESYFRVR